jgi:hypothetical protein
VDSRPQSAFHNASLGVLLHACQPVHLNPEPESGVGVGVLVEVAIGYVSDWEYHGRSSGPESARKCLLDTLLRPAMPTGASLSCNAYRASPVYNHGCDVPGPESSALLSRLRQTLGMAQTSSSPKPSRNFFTSAHSDKGSETLASFDKEGIHRAWTRDLGPLEERFQKNGHDSPYLTSRHRHALLRFRCVNENCCNAADAKRMRTIMPMVHGTRRKRRISR